MPKTRPPYAPEFRWQIVELARAGRDPADLAREFEPSAQAIRNWVAQADRQEGRREVKTAAAAETALSAAEREELARLRREVRQLRVERDILSRSAVGTHRVSAMGPGPGLPARPALSRPGFRVHEREPGPFPHRHDGARARRVQGRLLRLATPSRVAHARVDAALLERIRAVHVTSRRTYGAPRVHAALRAGGERHSRKRIERLMREAGLVGASHCRGGPVTTRRNEDARPAPDLVDRDFAAAGPNQLWIADITYIPTAAGFLYLVVVLDAWSRLGTAPPSRPPGDRCAMVVGWAMADHLRADPRIKSGEVLNALVGHLPRDMP